MLSIVKWGCSTSKPRCLFRKRPESFSPQFSSLSGVSCWWWLKAKSWFSHTRCVFRETFWTETFWQETDRPMDYMSPAGLWPRTQTSQILLDRQRLTFSRQLIRNKRKNKMNTLSVTNSTGVKSSQLWLLDWDDSASHAWNIITIFKENKSFALREILFLGW